MEQRRRFSQDRDVRYVFHPYFGYLPTSDVTEDIADDINLEQLFQLHPRHGFVPALDDKADGYYGADYDERMEGNFGGNFYPKGDRIPPNGDAYNDARNEKPMVIKIMGKPTMESPDEMDSLNRNRREPQMILPQVYYQPAPPVAFYPPSPALQQPSMFYQPQYVYSPGLRNVQTNPILNPVYTLPEVNNVDIAGVSPLEVTFS